MPSKTNASYLREILKQNGCEDYTNENLNKILKKLNNDYYKDIKAGALWDSVKKGEEPVYLNDHGLDHVICVENMAGELIKVSKISLNCYEIYILLLSIFIHDAGNIRGRKDHEKNCVGVVLELQNLVGDDTTEKRLIASIAAVHGGKIEGNKDTISNLKKYESILDKEIRPQLIAAILRFADELADDRSRASRYMLENKLLDGSEIFHKYSYSLISVKPKLREVSLRYELEIDDLKRKFKKLDDEVYIMDEIFARTWKMHLERTYCSRFFGSEIDIDKIKVTIEIFENFHQNQTISPFEEIGFELKELGYPNESIDGLFSIKPELAKYQGESMHKKVVKS